MYKSLLETLNGVAEDPYVAGFYGACSIVVLGCLGLTVVGDTLQNGWDAIVVDGLQRLQTSPLLNPGTFDPASVFSAICNNL
jgi:hypothetical protein